MLLLHGCTYVCTQLYMSVKCIEQTLSYPYLIISPLCFHAPNPADIVRSSFLEAGLESTDSRPFAPHLTIAKLSKLPQRKYSKRLRLSKDLYSGFTDEFHGSHAVSDLELLSMSRPTTPEGYYHCFARSSWVSGEQVSSDGWEGRGK